MIVERVWVGNRLRNYNYLIACEVTGEALAVDPLDYRACLRVARERGFDVTQVLNTHEHADHIGGNHHVVAATGAEVIAHVDAAIPDVDRRVRGGDVVRVGKTVELACLDTPGHTMSHVCLLSRGPEAALFSGDTLFNAGAGNCHNGGHPEVLYETFSRQLAQLEDSVRLYPGHDYLVGNLRFTLDRDSLVVRGKENPTSQFDLLEVVDVTPTEKIMYPVDHPDFVGGELGECNPGA